jgi:hypothetical protein
VLRGRPRCRRQPVAVATTHHERTADTLKYPALRSSQCRRSRSGRLRAATARERLDVLREPIHAKESGQQFGFAQEGAKHQ